MTSFNPSGLANIALQPVNLALMVPSVTFANTWGTHIVFTDAGTYTSPDSFKNINIEINDEDGGTVQGSITSLAGTATLATDSSKLKQTGPYKIKVTVVSALGVTADGIATVTSYDATGAEGNYQIGFTTANHS